MTQIHVHANRPKMGRRKLWHENINLTLPKGAKAQMDSVLLNGEDRLDMIRDAIEREIRRRVRVRSQGHEKSEK